MFNFQLSRQVGSMDCGPACLHMISRHFGKKYSVEYISSISNLSREGLSVKDLIDTSTILGLRATPVKIEYDAPADFYNFFTGIPLPLIAHWSEDHFVVIYKIGEKKIWVADPAIGKYKLTPSAFRKKIIGNSPFGVAILFESSSTSQSNHTKDGTGSKFSFLLPYLSRYKKLGWQLLFGIIVSNLIAVFFPFLTQAVVDSGIANRDIGLIKIILLGQFVLFAAQIFTQFAQSWIVLHIGARLNISFINDFLKKLMSLPIGYFDKRMTGDLLQRISDHKRIESFFTGTTVGTILSLFNLISFSVVLLYYSTPIFLTFAFSSILYFAWIFYFLKVREKVDHLLFKWNSEAKDNVIELIMGMPDIKLSGSEVKRRWQWTEIQTELFNTRIKSLKVSQLQDVGASVITQSKDIIITLISATMVVEGKLSLGMMLAIQFIVGQLNGPLRQLISFIRGAQDAGISLDRLKEIYSIESESIQNNASLPSNELTGDITLKNINFKHGGMSDYLFKELSLNIPYGKTTAIVGTSGSGKTTLLKLILGYYKVQSGSIMIGNHDIDSIDFSDWRKQCGVVDQSGFLFSDTIANNVGESSTIISKERVAKALYTAKIQEFVESLPKGVNTMIGRKGNGLSQGQKQRLLIARAIYKDPSYLFFDEATNSLDAETERIITNRLNNFLQQKTAIIIAHRLSTVTNADNIIVLSHGEIVEQGTHDDLIELQGFYYKLIKNQLELGN